MALLLATKGAVAVQLASTFARPPRNNRRCLYACHATCARKDSCERNVLSHSLPFGSPKSISLKIGELRGQARAWPDWPATSQHKRHSLNRVRSKRFPPWRSLRCIVIVPAAPGVHLCRLSCWWLPSQHQPVTQVRLLLNNPMQSATLRHCVRIRGRAAGC